MVEPLQSAYRFQYSTKTALSKVKTDIFCAMDNQKVTCLIMLDLSVAFDTVLHSLLFNRLKFRFGMGGTIIKWLKYCLAGHTQRVALHNAQSDPAVLKQGVPKDLCWVHSYLVSTSPLLGDICRRHNVEFHSYADDQQNYFSFEPRPVTKSGLKIYKNVSETSAPGCAPTY